MDPIIEVKDLKIKLGGAWIHTGINLSVERGEILAIVGGSGAGKSVLLREMLMLEKPNSGSIHAFGVNLLNASQKKLAAVRRRWGVLFQHNALFSSLTVLENIGFPLVEYTKLSRRTIKELALMKMLEAGLPMDAAYKRPSELSGGMEKHAALARANVLDPEILFLDEPTSGLDPHSASEFDALILELKAIFGLTVIMVTHDVDTLWQVTDRVAFLGDGKVLAVAPMRELIHDPHPMIQQYFAGPRGRVTQEIYNK